MRKEESHMKLVNLGNGNVVNADDVGCVFDLNQLTDKQYSNRMRETGQLGASLHQQNVPHGCLVALRLCRCDQSYH